MNNHILLIELSGDDEYEGHILSLPFILQQTKLSVKTGMIVLDFLCIFNLASAVFYLKYLVEANAESKRSLAGDGR